MDHAAGRRLEAAIREARGRRPVTEIADAAQVQRQTLYKWFVGGTPRLPELQKVARVLGISLASLVAAWDDPSGALGFGVADDLSPATRAVLERQAAEIEGLRLAVADLAAALQAAPLRDGSRR